MRIAQILNNKAHWIFEAVEKPEFAQNIILMDITGQDDVCEGWDYDEETGAFTAPVVEPIIDDTPGLLEDVNANYLETQYQTALLEMQAGF